MAEAIDKNNINNNTHDEFEKNGEKTYNFNDLEKQFNEIKDFLGIFFQNGTKKIKDTFTNRNKKKINIDDLDIGSHPIIIEKFNSIDSNTSDIKERICNLELQFNDFKQYNNTNEELYQRRYNNTTEMISDNYYNTNKKFERVDNTIEQLKSNVNKINKILEIMNEQKIDPMETRVDNIETTIYEIKNGVDYVIDNVDPNQIKQNTISINKLLDNQNQLLENHDKIKLDIVSIKDDNKSLDDKIEEHVSKIQSSIILLD